MTDYLSDDTIIAPATVPGTGAISVIRISGSRSLEITDAIVRFRSGDAGSCPGGRVKYGSVFSADGTLLDEVLVSVFRSPHSYTGEDGCELMCHASSYIVGGILELALAKGCRLAEPGEFTRRAFINGKMDLSQAEAVADVIASGDAASHRVAMNQLKGGFSDELARLREALLRITSLLELELDFSEEEVEFAGRAELRNLLDRTLAKVETLASSFRLGNAIRNGVPVAIVGDANAGKSTLLNAILGEQRAIVSDIAGTTRDTVEECLNVGGVTFRFIDTAGIRQADGEIEKIGIERSFESLRKADVVIVVVDGSSAPKDSGSLKRILEACDPAVQKIFVALNKSDLGLHSPDLAAFDIKPEIVSICAKNGSGVAELLAKIADYEKTLIGRASAASVLVTNARHHSALTGAASDLRRVRAGLDAGVPTDILAEDLRAALSTLGSITGAISSDEVLGEIFGRFCIGK